MTSHPLGPLPACDCTIPCLGLSLVQRAPGLRCYLRPLRLTPAGPYGPPLPRPPEYPHILLTGLLASPSWTHNGAAHTQVTFILVSAWNTLTIPQREARGRWP